MQSQALPDVLNGIIKRGELTSLPANIAFSHIYFRTWLNKSLIPPYQAYKKIRLIQFLLEGRPQGRCYLFLYPLKAKKTIYSITSDEYGFFKNELTSHWLFEQAFSGMNDEKLPLHFWRKEGYNPMVEKAYQAIHARLKDALAEEIPKLINDLLVLVEIGCGNGELLDGCLKLPELAQKEVRAIGVDPNVLKLKKPFLNNLTTDSRIVFIKAGIEDLLTQPCLDKEENVVILFSGFNTRRVVSGTKKAWENLLLLYPFTDVILWAGFTSPLATQKMLKHNFHVTISNFWIKENQYTCRIEDNTSYLSSYCLYQLKKKTLCEKMQSYRGKLQHTNTLDLSFEFQPNDILNNLTKEERQKITELILVEANMVDEDILLKNLKKLKSLQTLYLSFYQPIVSRLKLPPDSSIKVYLLNSTHPTETVFLSVSETKKIHQHSIIPFFGKHKNDYLRYREALTKVLLEQKSFWEKIKNCLKEQKNPCHIDIMHLVNIITNQIQGKAILFWSMVKFCNSQTSKCVLGNKYDNAIFFLENLKRPQQLVFALLFIREKFKMEYLQQLSFDKFTHLPALNETAKPFCELVKIIRKESDAARPKKSPS